MYEHPPTECKWHTIAEISDRYFVSTGTVRSWIKTGRLTAHKLGRVVRIAECDLKKFEAKEMAPIGVEGHRLKRAPSKKKSPTSARRGRTRSKSGDQNG